MITVEKLDKGTYFDDAFKVSFKYDPTTVAKIKELAERRYLPDDRAWEIPAYELPNLVEKLGINNINSNSGVLDALKTKEIEDKREATQQRLKDIKPVIDFDFTTTPLPHQIEAFNYGLERDELLIGDEQGLGKTKESIDITVARKKELCKCLIVCGVNSVKYNWEAEIKTHSKEKSVMLDQKTMPLRVKALNEWLRGSEYYAIINIESLRNEAVQDAIYLGIKDGFIGCIIVDEIHKAKNGNSQQGKALRTLKAPVKIGLSGTPMNKAEDLWNILTWLGVEKRSFYSFRSTYCIMGGYGGYRVVGHKNLESLNAELNKVMLRRKKEEVLDLPPKIHSTEYVELISYNSLMEIMQIISERLQANTEVIKADMVNWLTTLKKQLQRANGGATEAELKKEELRKDRLLDALLDGVLTKEEYSRKATVIDTKITEIKKEMLANRNSIEDIAEIDRVLANIDEEIATYLDENNQLKVDFILEHLESVEIFPDRVVVMIPLFSEGMVVYKSQYVSGEKRNCKNNSTTAVRLSCKRIMQ